MTNIVAVCAMYHLDEMERMLTIATSQAEDLGYNIVDVIRSSRMHGDSSCA